MNDGLSTSIELVLFQVYFQRVDMEHALLAKSGSGGAKRPISNFRRVLGPCPKKRPGTENDGREARERNEKTMNREESR